MKTRLLALILAALMLLTLVGCTKTGTDTPATDAEASKGEGYTIGFSNFSLSDSWRVQMEAEFKHHAEELKANGIENEVKVIQTGCFGLCALGPIMIVYPEGTFYSRVNKDEIHEIVTEHLMNDRIVKHLVYQETVHTDGTVLPLGETRFYKKQKRVALRNCGMINPECIDEYIGTNGWFRLKYQNKPDNVFEKTPESPEKLIRLVKEVEKLGEFITYDEACNKLQPLDDILNVDDDNAWHGARASTWASTPMARILRPWQDLVREKLHEVKNTLDDATVEKVWYHLTNSYNSDGQWPPTLPDAPHIIYPFNYQYCFENLLAAELLVGGVDRNKLTSSPIDTMKEILTIQQDLILDKADTLLASGTDDEKAAAKHAKVLIEKSRNLDSVSLSSDKILSGS